MTSYERVRCPQREEAREGARRAVEAAGRDGDQPQAAAGGRRRRARQVMPLHPLDDASHSYFLLCIHIFTYVFIFSI